MTADLIPACVHRLTSVSISDHSEHWLSVSTTTALCWRSALKRSSRAFSQLSGGKQQHNLRTNQATAEGTGDRDLQLHARALPCFERSLSSAAGGRRLLAGGCSQPQAVNLQVWFWGSRCSDHSVSTAMCWRAGPLQHDHSNCSFFMRTLNPTQRHFLLPDPHWAAASKQSCIPFLAPLQQQCAAGTWGAGLLLASSGAAADLLAEAVLLTLIPVKDGIQFLRKSFTAQLGGDSRGWCTGLHARSPQDRRLPDASQPWSLLALKQEQMSRTHSSLRKAARRSLVYE